jgi:hypothetical protein
MQVDSAEPLARSCAIGAGVELHSTGLMAAALRALAIMPFEPTLPNIAYVLQTVNQHPKLTPHQRPILTPLKPT